MAKKKNKVIEESEIIPAKKTRKIVAGPIRDKERTKRRLIATVGKVLQKYTYAGLTITNIAKESGLNPKLIYLYFGNLDGLIEEYILEKDFWAGKLKTQITELAESSKSLRAKDANDLFQLQFDSFLKDKSMQRIIHWEMGVKNKLLRKIADEREEVGKNALDLISTQFKNTDVDIQATLAIILGGIYYLTLHAKNNGSTVGGIDINEDEGRERIEKTMERLIFRDFEDAEKKKTSKGKK
ncbi:TetR/AcrR family transcriptional regulator [Sphingobacterium corticibacterium]|uniref:TetR/AcrR family transcriptional regulator n=1 Tax=Sphingobacterium corticibacterium TaxID=2484746 RepID=A0A4V2DCR5_9SPHI|nr:TetR/AcrR family transcriptional regulator [Sphingobacterium corticibacterium]RZF62408.1 TetR/AcrR family transcriptional regulator [Sphingobacterium corticibacterium]